MRTPAEPTLRRLALGMFGLGVALTVVVIAVAPAVRGHPGLAQPEGDVLSAGDLVDFAVMITVASVLARLRPANPIGWLLGLAAVLGDLNLAGGLCGAYLVLVAGHPQAGTLLISLTAPLWIPALLLPATSVLARYPSGRVAGRWARRFDRGVVVGCVLVYVVYVGSPESVTDQVVGYGPPVVLPEFVEALLGIPGVVLLLAGLAGVVAGTIARMLRAGPPERQQIALLLATAVLALAAAFAPYEWCLTVAYALIPVAIAVGVLRYRLLGIEVVLRRTLLYGLLTGLVVLVFVAVTAALAAVLPRGPAPTVVAASLVAVGLAPARDRLQRVVDKIIYGDRDDPWSALGRLSRPVGGTPGEELLPQIAAALGGALRVPGVAIDTGAQVVRWGELSRATQMPLVFDGDAVGTLAVSVRRGENAPRGADQRLLEAVAPLVAAVVHAVTLASRLADARGRLVHATLDERARLRQDLHDGLGPSLTGIGLGLEALQAAAGPSELISRLREEVARSLTDVRTIIDDLRPATLDQHGLLGAIRVRAAQAGASTGLRVDLALPDRLDLPPDLEAAVFRITDEALTNVLKHARATICTIRIEAAGRLLVRVRDDGVGMNGGRDGGLGMQSMRERTERCGGTFTARDADPGTEIAVELPLREEVR